MQFRLHQSFGPLLVKAAIDLVHIWIDIVIISENGYQALRAVGEQVGLLQRLGLGHFHHISCPIVCKSSHRLQPSWNSRYLRIETDESFLLRCLTTNVA